MTQTQGSDSVGHAHRAMLEFLVKAHQPAVVEPGEEAIPLTPGSYSIDARAGRLSLHAWTEHRNLVRSITGLKQEKHGMVELKVERFGRREGSIQLLDLARPQLQSASRRNGRVNFREQFRRYLRRQFPSWTLSELSTEPDLEHSLSPAYSRAVMKRGNVAWAAIGADDPSGADGALTFGLVWLDYLRRRPRMPMVEGLVLFLPEGHERTTCLRLLHLNGLAAQWAVFVHSKGGEEPVDLRDHGNIDTTLPRRTREPQPDREWVERLAALPNVEALEHRDGLSFRVLGIEFARYAQGQFWFGIDSKQKGAQANSREVEVLASELARLRSSLGSPLYGRSPELWLESQVRRNVTAIHAALMETPLYGQVPAFVAGDRGTIDLLACDRSGRLCVIELKASEDIHLPLQALDYWIRVNWHVERDDFQANGYFPGVALLKQSPRLLLVAPALCFHPATETILRYFPPSVDVERIGVGMNWRHELKVMFQFRGCQRPISGG